MIYLFFFPLVLKRSFITLPFSFSKIPFSCNHNILPIAEHNFELKSIIIKYSILNTNYKNNWLLQPAWRWHLRVFSTYVILLQIAWAYWGIEPGTVCLWSWWSELWTSRPPEPVHKFTNYILLYLMAVKFYLGLYKTIFFTNNWLLTY